MGNRNSNIVTFFSERDECLTSSGLDGLKMASRIEGDIGGEDEGHVHERGDHEGQRETIFA